MLQEYRNQSNEAIEAKYVFPLDDMAVVCGFEAFINGKHVIGKFIMLNFLSAIGLLDFRNVVFGLILRRRDKGRARFCWRRMNDIIVVDCR